MSRVELADRSASPLWIRNDDRTRGSGPPDIAVEPRVERMASLRASLHRAGSDAGAARPGSELDEMERRWKKIGRILGKQFPIEW